MGCASSKRIEADVGVYRPAPSSFAIFDINSIEEPWLKPDEDQSQQPQLSSEKPGFAVPAPLIEKLIATEDAPRTWDEVSKALEDLKPTLKTDPPIPILNNPNPSPAGENAAVDKKQAPRKRSSFHTLEELETKRSAPDSRPDSRISELKKAKSTRFESQKSYTLNPDQRMGSALAMVTDPSPDGKKRPVTENVFILRDRLERQKEGKPQNLVRRDPLEDYPEKCPPGGGDSVVLYTTSLGGVRRTYEDCNKVRTILESHQAVFDERDVSLHGEFLKEMKELLGEGSTVPRMFVKGRYIGGVEEVVNLNETGRLGRMMNWARVERGVGRQACEGCGGARFIPCLECGGSCKVVVDEQKQRCPLCNENGLVHCPACLL